MSDVTLYTLIATAGSTALFHTLIPDHWLPFVLIARARRWSGWTTAAVSGLSALIHVVLSVGLALAALGVGVASARAVGQSLERAAAPLLVVFGLAYAMWAWRKSGHFHPGGRHVHPAAGIEGCAGTEGPHHPEHLHYHADGELISNRPGTSGLLLAVLVGVNPCVLFLPLLMAAAPNGARAVALVTLAYSVPTVVLVVGLSSLAVVGGRRLRLPWAARWMETASGLMIALIGVLFWLLDHAH